MNLTQFVSMLAKLPVRHRDSNEMVPFRLFPNQITAMKKLGKQYEDKGKIRAIFLKSRRVTVSSLCDSYLFCDCLSAPNRENLIVAHVADTSKGLFRVPRDLANAIPLPAGVCEVQTKNIRVNHREGVSTLDIATAGTVSSGRGLTLTGLHLSEAAFYPGQDSFLSLLPAVSEGRDTCVFVETTANGTTGIGETFYDFWQSAVERRNDYVPIFLGWLTDPACIADPANAEDAPATDLERELVRDFKANKAQIAWMRLTLESKCQGYEKKFLQEYPHTESVAFISTNDPAFTPEEINFSKTTLKEPIAQGHMEWKSGEPRFCRVRDGALSIWEEPKPGHKYYLGMDAAVGMETGDFAAICVWDGTTGRQVAQYADKVVPEVCAFMVHCIGHYYNRAMTNGELTGNSGREVLRILRDHYHYPFFAMWKGKDDKLLGRGENRRPTVWWETTAYSRAKMFDVFRVFVRGGMRPKESLEVAIVRDPALHGQMSRATLSTGGRWEVEKGHDDILVSAMLAIVALAQNPVPRHLNQSHIVESGEPEEDRIANLIPNLQDDVTLSLQRHYKKAMLLTRKSEAKMKREGINRLVGV